VAEITLQLLAHPLAHSQQDAAQQGATGGLQDLRGDQAEDPRSTDRHGQMGFPLQAALRGLEPGVQRQGEVVDQIETFQVAVERFDLQAPRRPLGAELHDRLDLELKGLQGFHRIAIVTLTERIQLAGIQEGPDDPVVVVEVESQSLGLFGNRKLEHLAGAEGQGHRRAQGGRREMILSTHVSPPCVMRLAFLGPVGTYGEQAARILADLEGLTAVELVPQNGHRAVIQALADGQCDAAVVPVENSVEGGVTASLDALWEHSELRIRRGLVLPIRHGLLGSGPISGVSEVLSHPQALAQCSLWLADHLPAAWQLPTSSTAEASRMVRGSHFRAAVASLEAASQHGLEVLAYPINDVPGNCTRFLLLQREPAMASACTHSSLAFSLHANRPGALLEALGCFARRQLNMSRIESRPSKREMGEYLFFVDLELPADPRPLEQAIEELSGHCQHLALFGTYPITNLNDDNGEGLEVATGGPHNP